MNNSISSSYYDMRSFPDLVVNLAAENAKMYNVRQSYNGQGCYNMKFFNYYQQSSPYVPQVYGNNYQKQRYTPYPNRNYGGNGVVSANGNGSANPSSLPHVLQVPQQQQQQQQQMHSLFQQQGSSSFNQPATSNKSLNSSLNSSSFSDSGKNSTFYSSNHSGCSSPHQSNYSNDSASMSSNSSTINTSVGPGTYSGSSSSSVSPVPHPQPIPQSTSGNATETALMESPDQKEAVVLQISNLDATIEEHKMQQFLMCQLKNITPVLSLTIESPSLAKVKVPSVQCAKNVVSSLHRKKIGHKRMVVSYIKDPSSAESSALRCQVAGLLKDVPKYSLPIYRFRELFQSRFKSSISVLDLYRMQDVCTISLDKSDEKHIALRPALIDTLKNNALVETSQHSVPYCMYHFQQENEKGWAEQEIEPLPNVVMNINQLQSIVYLLLKSHKNDIPVASVLYCIEHELQIKIMPNDNGVPLEHLLCCIRGVKITNNSFGIKVLSWVEHEQNFIKDNDDMSSSNLRYMPKTPSNDNLQHISREVVELIKMSPKSTMKFTRFIPAYHNHFGRQCRVADYGYTRLIELFEALSPVVQVMGDGENRHITLTHRTQIRRFTNDLLKILRNRANKSILLSQLPSVFMHAQNRPFDVTDYGVCNLYDIVDGLVYNNYIMTKVHNENDVLISLVKRKQSPVELERMSVFAGESVELFRKAPQFSINFKSFVRSYHYHFGYQCRLSDYGLIKLADLLEAMNGILEMEHSNDEDRKIHLNYQVALRVFAEQIQGIIKAHAGKPTASLQLSLILHLHKSHFGYQLQPNCLGFTNIYDALKALPYTEVFESGGEYMVMSYLEDPIFRMRTYAACMVLIESHKDRLTLSEFIRGFQARFKEFLNEKQISNMKHALTIELDKGLQTVTMTKLMKFVIRIVQVVKLRVSINVNDLKMALNVSFGTCFEFGYPNFLSILKAFPDIFVTSNFPHINDKSDIELNRDCILAKPSLGPEENVPFPGASLGMGAANPKHPIMDARYRSAAMPRDLTNWRNITNHNYPQQQPQKSVQSIECEKSSLLFKVPRQQQAFDQLHHGPLQPTQAIHQYGPQQALGNPSFVSWNSMNTPLSGGSSGNGKNLNALMPLGGAGSLGFITNVTGDIMDKENVSPLQNAHGLLDPLQSKMAPTCANKFASTFGQDSLVNGALKASGDTVDPSRDHRHSTGALLPKQQDSFLSSWKINGENFTDLALYRKSIHELLYKYSEPPKPDTPPAMNLPHWLDPVWSNSLPTLQDYSMCSDAGKLLNIPIPELTSFNNLPSLDTPQTLLTEKLSRFTFDQDK